MMFHNPSPYFNRAPALQAMLNIGRFCPGQFLWHANLGCHIGMKFGKWMRHAKCAGHKGHSGGGISCRACSGAVCCFRKKSRSQ
jgi:hypothetical protein